MEFRINKISQASQKLRISSTINFYEMFKTKFNLPKTPIQTYPAHQGNQITEDYYNFLVGQINDGVIFRVVCRVTYIPTGSESYYLISER